MRAYYHSSGGSSGGWGYGGGSSGGYGYASSGGSNGYGSWGSSGGGYGAAYGGAYDTMIESGAPGEAAPYEEGPPPPPPGDDDLPPDADLPPDPDEPSAGGTRRLMPLMRSATLNVRVPLEAKVYVNGLATSSRGSLRRYVSNGLQPGYSYTYELRAEMVQDGRVLSETKTVKLEAGQSSTIDFAFADRNEPNERVAAAGLRTSLTLRVPADARVYLSGNETSSFGVVRHFSTTRLAEGDQWLDYEIKVEVDRDGQTLSREQTVSLAAGDARELTIDFDGPELALTASK
ncbi:MAG: TIGR03000 domain-containing protein [Pirellulales bacterium]